MKCTGYCETERLGNETGDDICVGDCKVRHGGKNYPVSASGMTRWDLS